MAQGVRPAMRDTGAAEGVADHPMDGIHADRGIVWSQATHEHGSVAGERSLMAQVRLQRLARGDWQWQHILAARLRPPQRERAVLPIDVVQL